MRLRTMESICGLLIAMMFGGTSAWAKEVRVVEPEAALTEIGRKLEARYAEQLNALKEEILKSAPQVDGQLVAALLKAYRQEVSLSDALRKASVAELKAGDKDPKIDAAKKEAARKATAEAEEAIRQAATSSLDLYHAVLKQVGTLLASDRLDAQLVKMVVLAEATPGGLAAFAQQGEAQEALVEKLLSDTDLMKQMVHAGGAGAASMDRR